ncbi:MAG: hypothetical protein DMG89_22720 [Acidobacteria bacterium]|nr:MAG: hypothetical protein DMG89_22720 [Acidobacteriota bacterium]
MRRLLGVLFCCCLFLLLSVTQLMGCGDKVLALGRAVRLRYASNHSASILLYLRPGSSTAAAMSSDVSLQSALKKSSQVLRIVNDSSQLDEALNRGKFDLLVADAADAAAIEQQLQAMAAHTVVVPVTSQLNKVEASAMAKHFHVVLKTPSKMDTYFMALDEAMEMKAKRDEVKVVAKK